MPNMRLQIARFIYICKLKIRSLDNGEMNFNPNAPCSYPGCNKRTGCHYSLHTANRNEINELARRYKHPTLILTALRVRAQWRYEQMSKKPRTSDVTDQPLSHNSEPDKVSTTFCLDTDNPSFVTCTCQWLLKSNDVREVKGCFIGFHPVKDFALIILSVDAADKGELTRVPLLCPSKYLPSDLQKKQEKAHGLSSGKENFELINVTPRKLIKDDGTTCNLLYDGVFNAKNKIICDDRLIASIEAGLVHVKRKAQRKYAFRFAARQNFWFEEGRDDIHDFVLEVHRNSNNNGIHLTQYTKNDASLIVMEIAQLAKYEVAKNDITSVSDFLTKLQNIGEYDPPSLYDKSLLFALCKKEEAPSPVGKVLPCRVRAEYKDNGCKSWTYCSSLCLCDVRDDCLKKKKNEEVKKITKTITHHND